MGVTLARYRGLYEGIARDFVASLAARGIDFTSVEEGRELNRRADALRQKIVALGGVSRYGGASVAVGPLSPGCEACATGVDSMTCMLSLQCHRNCFFCFNPNQENYRNDSQGVSDWRAQLDDVAKAGKTLTHVALTGGEPLLHKNDAMAFFAHARSLFSGVRTRLYTSGDLLDPSAAKSLEQAGLEEVRVSLKPDDSASMWERVLANLAAARACGLRTMVEMPVMPGSFAAMCRLLERLDAMGVDGINLLELGFPLHNWEAFAARGLQVKNPPFDVLYEYGYAGGLPIARSEVEALRLVLFGQQQGLSLAMHYCSLDNKHRGEVYQANVSAAGADTLVRMCPETFFLKTLKVFDGDRAVAKALLQAHGIPYRQVEALQCVQCAPDAATLLAKAGIEAAVSVNVQERRGNKLVMRELGLLSVEEGLPAAWRAGSGGTAAASSGVDMGAATGAGAGA